MATAGSGDEVRRLKAMECAWRSRRCCHCHGCRGYHNHVHRRYHCHRRHCQYPRRFHGRLHRGPPDNGTADELNSENVRAYMQVCQQVRAWKKDKENHEQPRCPTTLELIDKMPSAPKPRKKHGHCHCHQLKASRKGTCPLACFFQGVQYACRRQLPTWLQQV